MSVPGIEYFTNGEVLLLGYSTNPQSFSRAVYKEFEKAGLTVYPVNPNREGEYDVRVFASLEDLPAVPETAYVAIGRKDSLSAVKSLEGRGVKRILFQSKGCVDEGTLEECRKMGMEPKVCCPVMMVSSSFPHNLHRFFANLSSR